jgi:hypothetical protein
MRNFHMWQQIAAENQDREARCAYERAQTNALIVAAIERRRTRLRQLSLQRGSPVVIKTENGAKRGEFHSVEESTYRIWVLGIDPLTPQNPRLCCPFSVTDIPLS